VGTASGWARLTTVTRGLVAVSAWVPGEQVRGAAPPARTCVGGCGGSGTSLERIVPARPARAWKTCPAGTALYLVPAEATAPPEQVGTFTAEVGMTRLRNRGGFIVIALETGLPGVSLDDSLSLAVSARAFSACK
jgi:hypothetical protein